MTTIVDACAVTTMTNLCQWIDHYHQMWYRRLTFASASAAESYGQVGQGILWLHDLGVVLSPHFEVAFQHNSLHWNISFSFWLIHYCTTWDIALTNTLRWWPWSTSKRSAPKMFAVFKHQLLCLCYNIGVCWIGRGEEEARREQNNNDIILHNMCSLPMLSMLSCMSSWSTSCLFIVS